MRETDNAGNIGNNRSFYAEELSEMIRLSEIVESDGIRFERRLDLEEECDAK